MKRILPVALALSLLAVSQVGCRAQVIQIIDRKASKSPLPAPPPRPPIPEGTRPNIYGCGVMWGNWFNLPTDKERAWNEKCFDMIVGMGGTNVGANFAWIDIEPERGKYNWDRVDHQVMAARERGLEIFAYTGLTPNWALPPEAPKQDGIGYRFPPDEKYIPDFENFFETLARRYRGWVKYYEFWNEPNGCSWINNGCSNGNMASTYVPWLKRWYKAMKKGDPDCVLAVGGLDYNAGVKQGYKYIEDIYASGGGDSFDAVAIHPYGEPLHWKAITDTYAVLVRHGDAEKKLWLNEYGWNTKNETKKAENLVEVLSKLKTREYHMVFQANYLVLTDLKPSDHDYGLCASNPQELKITPRESYLAFKNFDKTFPPNADVPPEGAELPAPPEPPAGPNLLQNPNFEEAFEPAPEEFQEEGQDKRMKAPGWELFGGNWWTRSGGTGNLNHTPFGAQSVGTNWGKLQNAVYQRVRATKGHTYRFSAYTRVDSPAAEGEFVRRRVGIDPTGGNNPFSQDIVWSGFSAVEEKWEQQTVEAAAIGDVITVFAQAESIEPNGWEWFHVDTAELVDVTKGAK